MKLRRWLIVGLVLLTPPMSVGACALHDDLLAARFEHISPGMTRNEVVSILGAPREIIDCSAPGPFKSRLPNCVETYLYPSWGAPLVPSMWTVRFDADGVAIDKYRFVSW